MYLVYVALLSAFVVEGYLIYRIRRIEQALKYHVSIGIKELLAERDHVIAQAIRGEYIAGGDEPRIDNEPHTGDQMIIPPTSTPIK